MNLLNIEPLELDKVILSIKDEEDHIRLAFSGVIDMRDPNIEILPYLLNMHKQIINKGLKIIKADISDLIFMNSSGIRTIISWIIKLNDLPERVRYKIKIIYNPRIMWQESSAQVMQQLFPDFINVEAI